MMAGVSGDYLFAAAGAGQIMKCRRYSLPRQGNKGSKAKIVTEYALEFAGISEYKLSWPARLPQSRP
jgi:hypothetical protein